MFLRGGLEWNAGRALGLLSIAALAPFILVWVPGMESWRPKLQELALQAAIAGVLSGWAAMFLLARAFAEWGVKAPMAIIGACEAVCLAGLVGAYRARPDLLPPPWPWVAGAVVLLVTGLLLVRLARLKDEE